MTFPDTEIMELCREHPTNIHNTRSLIRTLKYALDILQTEEDFMVKEYKHTHTHTHGLCKLVFANPERYLEPCQAYVIKQFLGKMVNS